jgi:hypothetical protein
MAVSNQTYRPTTFDTKSTSAQTKAGSAKAAQSPAQPPANAPAKKVTQGNTSRDTFESGSSKSTAAPRASTPAKGTAARDDFKAGTVKAGQASASTSGTQPTTAPADTKRKSLSGEERAKQEVDVQSVADTQTELGQGQDTLNTEVQAKVDDIFAMADGKKTRPDGVEVTKKSENEAVLERKDKDGHVVERTIAKRGTDVARLSLDTASYENGVNTRDHVELLQDGGSRVRHAEYPDKPNEVGAMKGFEEFEKSRDPAVSFTDNRLYRDPESKTVTQLNEYTQSGGAVTSSETTFTKQRNGDGIDDKLKGPFDFNQDVDKATTYTYSIPAPGTQDEQGKDVVPHYQRVQRFSQGDTQATAFNDKELHNERLYEEFGAGVDGDYQKAVGTEPHNLEDINALRALHQEIGGEEYFDNNNDAGENPQVPKRWLVEQQTGDTYRAQTFLEGQPNATITTERQRKGNNVIERYNGQSPNPADPAKLVPVGGFSTKTYAQDGSLAEMILHRQDPDGSNLDQGYSSRTKKQADGSILQGELTNSTYTDPQGKKTTTQQQDVSRLSGEGVQLISTKNTVTDPVGRQAVSSLDKNGEKLTLSGPGGKDPRDITDPKQFPADSDEEKLLLSVGGTTASTLKAFAESGGVKALEAVEKHLTKKYDATEKLPRPHTLDTVLGQQKLQGSIDEVKNAKPGFGLVNGAVGATAAGFALAEGIRSENKALIAVSSLGIAGGVLDVVGPALESPRIGQWLANALVGGQGGTSASSAVASTLSKINTLGKLASAGGAVLGAAFNIGQGAVDIKQGLEDGHDGQFAKGVTNVVGGVLGGVVGLGGALIGGAAGPIVGAVIGFATFVVGSIVELVNDDQHEISDLVIDDDGFKVGETQPRDYPTPEEIQQREQEEMERQREEEELEQRREELDGFGAPG